MRCDVPSRAPRNAFFHHDSIEIDKSPPQIVGGFYLECTTPCIASLIIYIVRLPREICLCHSSILALKNIVVQFNSKILGNPLHLCLHLVFHARAHAEQLLDFAGVEDDITAENHALENQMPA